MQRISAIVAVLVTVPTTVAATPVPGGYAVSVDTIKYGNFSYTCRDITIVGSGNHESTSATLRANCTGPAGYQISDLDLNLCVGWTDHPTYNLTWQVYGKLSNYCDLMNVTDKERWPDRGDPTILECEGTAVWLHGRCAFPDKYQLFGSLELNTGISNIDGIMSCRGGNSIPVVGNSTIVDGP